MKRVLTPTNRLLLAFLAILCYGSVLAQQRMYRTTLKYKEFETSGLCITNENTDSSIDGTIVNDFGIKIFDFQYKDGNVRLNNIFPIIDKWYISHELQKDMFFLLSHWNDAPAQYKKRHKTLIITTTGIKELNNEKRRLTYLFKEIISETN